MEVRVEENNVDKALKILKKKIQKEQLLKDLKKRRFYEKPSVKRKNKQREARRRRAKSAFRRKTAQ